MPRTASVMSRSSRISSGSTSRVPEGMGWICGRTGAVNLEGRTGRGLRGAAGLVVDGLGGDALDARAELAQALVDALVAAVDLADVADLRASLGAQGRDEHRHAGADVGRLDALAAQP